MNFFMNFIKKINTKTKIIASICLALSILTLSLITKQPRIEEVIETSSTLSNQKIGWGIKRNDNHIQPDLGATNKKLIEQYNGIAMGSSEKNSIYLTFDAGYEAGHTEKILDALKEKNVKATFFITAHYLNTASNMVERMINEGHIVGNHTSHHFSMPEISDEKIKTELMTLNQAVYEKFGYEMKFMRPPKGEFSERTLAITESLGFKTVMWSFAYVDWNEGAQPDRQDAINKIVSNLHNGEIMLLHSTSKTNAEIMGELIDKVRQEGYELKSLEEFN